MKVAVCLFGIVGGRSGKNGQGGYIDYELCAEHYKKHIFNNNDVDVFIHTWSHELEEELTRLYNPKDAIFEKQIEFKPKASHRGKSRWYSNKSVLDLVRKSENKSGKKYDAVMVTRFDTMFLKDMLFDEYDPSYFYAPNWNNPPLKRCGSDNPVKRINASLARANSKSPGFSDLWFLSNSDYMHSFSKLYNQYDKYHPSPHRASWSHVHTFVPAKMVAYSMHRWFDFELYRWKVEGVYE